jgi:hypothetical protein
VGEINDKSDRLLGTPCHVSQAFDPIKGISDCARILFDAMWDTGAAKSVITERVVKALGLKPIRKGFTQGVNGLGKSQAYGKVWWNVLLGMDIIGTGDFSITNRNGNTEFFFSVPSLGAS